MDALIQRIDRLSESGVVRFRHETGVTFQFFYLLGDLTVADNVLPPAQLTGLRTIANAYPARLSGAERQRVARARALVPGLDGGCRD